MITGPWDGGGGGGGSCPEMKRAHILMAEINQLCFYISIDLKYKGYHSDPPELDFLEREKKNSIGLKIELRDEICLVDVEELALHGLCGKPPHSY
jgi:hypothetical protein